MAAAGATPCFVQRTGLRRHRFVREDAMADQDQIGFIGLGKMGRPMVERLLSAGFTVHVFNRSRAVPVFRAFGKNIKLCGPAGAGQVVRLVNQLLVGVHAAAAMEAAVFGTKLGADPRVLLEVIGTSFGASTMLTRNLPRFISRDFTPASSIGLIAKDLGLIHDEARTAGAALFLGALAEQRFLEARARGLGDLDMAAARHGSASSANG